MRQQTDPRVRNLPWGSFLWLKKGNHRIWAAVAFPSHIARRNGCSHGRPSPPCDLSSIVAGINELGEKAIAIV
jgi:hypothetical protein